MKCGVQEFQQALIFGLGFNQRIPVEERLVEQGYLITPSDGTSSLHNEAMDSLVKRGLVGFMALLALYLVPLSLFVKQYRMTTDQQVRITCISGIAMIGAYFFAGLTERFLFNHIAATLYAFLIPALWCATLTIDSIDE